MQKEKFCEIENKYLDSWYSGMFRCSHSVLVCSCARVLVCVCAMCTYVSLVCRFVEFHLWTFAKLVHCIVTIELFSYIATGASIYQLTAIFFRLFRFVSFILSRISSVLAGILAVEKKNCVHFFALNSRYGHSWSQIAKRKLFLPIFNINMSFFCSTCRSS